MKRGRLPLTALRSFEVAGRHLSFTRAAEELFVSQAAISRQIRELEAMLGTELFERRHRAVVLTDAGRQLLQTLTSAFDAIDDRLTSVRTTADLLHVTVSTEPGFAAQWLVPALPRFHAEHPDVEVTVESDARLVNFRSGEARLGVRFSATASQWPNVVARRLGDSHLAPVLSPMLAASRAIATPADLLELPLLHEETRSLWKDWFEIAGVTLSNPIRGTVLADGALTIQAAISGQGVALCDPFFSRTAVENGLLVQPFPLTIPCGAYHLVARNFDKLPEGASLFADWLRRQFMNGA